MENEAELLVELFFEDIKACIDDPDIPTCRWAITAPRPTSRQSWERH